MNEKLPAYFVFLVPSVEQVQYIADRSALILAL